MSIKRYLVVTSAIFALVALLQLVRFLLGWPVSIAGIEVPLAASAIAFVVASGMAAWALLLLRAPRTD